VKAGDLDDVLGGQHAPLLAKALAHLRPHLAGVDELDQPLALRLLAVGEQPHVAGDAGVVEELLGQRHDRLEQVVFEDPPPDVALARPGGAGEQRRAVVDDRDPRPAVAGLAHLRHQVHQEQQLAVGLAREPRAEPPV
jgi:hypothetical protein